MIKGRRDENEFIISRVQNATNTAEGPVLPPKQIGATRVPLVTNLRVLKTESFIGGTEFTIAFDEPPLVSKIANYQLFYSIGGTPDLNNAGTCRRSPARFNVNTPNALTVSIIVVTHMGNGFSSDPKLSPSCTGKTIAGTVTPADLTGLNIVFGGNNLLTPGLIPYVLSPTVLTTDPQLQYDASTKAFANSAGAPTSKITTDGSVGFGVDDSNYAVTFTPGDIWLTTVDTSGGALNIDLPSAAGTPGRWYVFKKTTGDTNTLTVTGDGSDTIDGSATASITAAFGLLSVVRTSASTWAIV